MFSSRIYARQRLQEVQQRLERRGIPASYGQKDVVPAKSPPSNQKENGQITLAYTR